MIRCTSDACASTKITVRSGSAMSAKAMGRITRVDFPEPVLPATSRCSHRPCQRNVKIRSGITTNLEPSCEASKRGVNPDRYVDLKGLVDALIERSFFGCGFIFRGWFMGATEPNHFYSQVGLWNVPSAGALADGAAHGETSVELGR